MTSPAVRTAAWRGCARARAVRLRRSIHRGGQAQPRRPDQDERHGLPRPGRARTSARSTSTSATPPTGRASTSAPQVRGAVEARGYRVVDDPRAARFVLQANVLQAGRTSETAAEVGVQYAASAARCWAVPPAGPPATAWAQAGIGVNDAGGAIGGALAGAAISALADAYVQDTTYTIVTDVQVSERAPGGRWSARASRPTWPRALGHGDPVEQRDHRRQALPDPGRQHRQSGQPRLAGRPSRNSSPA